MPSRCIGSLVLAVVIAGVGFAQGGGARDARDIISAAIAAKGGKEQMKKLPAWHLKYRETFLRDGKELVEVGDAHEHLSRLQARYQTAPDDLILVNGKEGWVKKGDKLTALTPGQLADFEEYFRGKEAMLTLLPLLKDEWKCSVVGEKEIDGRPAVAVRIIRKEWDATIYLDKQTHLLVGALYPHKRLSEVDDSKRVASMRLAHFSDYKAIEGIQFHRKLLSFSKGKQLGQVELTAIEMMKQLPDSVLAAPK